MNNKSQLESINKEEQIIECESQRTNIMFNSFFEVTPDLFFLVDNNCTIIDFKATKYSDLYVSPEQFIGKKMDGILPQNIGCLFKESIIVAKEKNELVSFEYDLTMPIGNQHFECRVNYILDSGLFIAVIRNITDKYLSTKALAASEERYRSLLENAPFPILIIRIKDRTMRYGNIRAQQQLGFSNTQGAFMKSSQFYENPKEQQKFLELFFRQGFITDYEIKLLDWNHNPYWALLSASQVDFESEPSIMVSINDISIRKETELALQKEQKSLKERLKERNCTQEVFEISGEDELEIDTMLMKLVNVIGKGWQYPEITSVRIEFGDNKYNTPEFQETNWMEIKEGFTKKGDLIRLTVAYIEKRNDEYKGPFLKEEEALAKTIVERLIDVMNKRTNLASIREKDELVNIMFNQTLESIVLVNPMSNRFTSFNDASYLGLGYSKEEFSLLSVKDIQADHSSEEIKENISKAINGQQVTFETHHICKNGDLQEAIVTITPILYQEKPFVCVIWRDITKQNKQLSELRALSRAVDQSPVSIVIANLEGAIQYANPMACKTTGYNLEELMGNNPRVLKSGETPDEEYSRIWRNISQGHEWKGIFHNKRKNGELYWESSMITPIVDDEGNITHYLGIKEDITEIKKKETEIQKLTIAIEQSPVAAVITDLDGNIEYVSSAFEKITGYNSLEIIGSHTRILKSGKTKDIVYKNLWETIESGRSWQGEWLNKKKNGEFYWESISVTPIYEQNGTMTSYLAIKEDITKQKQADQDHIDREAAEAANRAKSAFLSNMSHEIRTPLNAIIGFAQILKRDDSLSSKQIKHIKTILRSGEHLMNLINDILDLSRIEAGYSNIIIMDFNLHDLLDDVFMMFQLRAKDKGINLFLDIDKSIPTYVTGDEAKLRQVLINLMGNAVKFTETGSVSLRAHVEVGPSPNMVYYGENKEALSLIVVVEDTGPGISEEDKKRIFDSFYQAKAGQIAGGTGLGLAITKNLIELMGGSIYVESSMEKGSSFKFFIPVKGCNKAEKKPVKMLENVVGIAPGTGPYRVLVADDRKDNRELLRELLEPIGFDIKEAVNGKEALEIFDKWNPHAVLMDMNMPVMDGYEATRRIKATEKGLKTLIIGVTVSAFGSDIERVLAAGTDKFLSKPFRPEELFMLLGKLSGIKYVFDEDLKPNYHIIDTRSVNLEDINSLPRDLVRNMSLAVEQGNISMLRKLLLEVESINPRVSQELEALARQYDYEKLTNLFEQGR